MSNRATPLSDFGTLSLVPKSESGVARLSYAKEKEGRFFFFFSPNLMSGQLGPGSRMGHKLSEGVQQGINKRNPRTNFYFSLFPQKMSSFFLFSFFFSFFFFLTIFNLQIDTKLK